MPASLHLSLTHHFYSSFPKFWISVCELRLPHTSFKMKLPGANIVSSPSTFYVAGLFQAAHLSLYSLSTKLQFVWGSFKSLFFLNRSSLSCPIKKVKPSRWLVSGLFFLPVPPVSVSVFFLSARSMAVVASFCVVSVSVSLLITD